MNHAPMNLDLETLRACASSLERSLEAALSAVAGIDQVVAETLRSGVIRRFEKAYEQSWREMQAWLRRNVPPAGPDEPDRPRGRRGLFRSMARCGLIRDPQTWIGFGEVHDLTSRTPEDSEAAYKAARDFPPFVRELLARLDDPTRR